MKDILEEHLKNILEDQFLKVPPTRYVMGVDANSTVKAYCLMRYTGNTGELILSKSKACSCEIEEYDFEEEVENLSEYFNAEIIMETR